MALFAEAVISLVDVMVAILIAILPTLRAIFRYRHKEIAINEGLVRPIVFSTAAAC